MTQLRSLRRALIQYFLLKDNLASKSNYRNLHSKLEFTISISMTMSYFPIDTYLDNYAEFGSFHFSLHGAPNKNPTLSFLSQCATVTLFAQFYSYS